MQNLSFEIGSKVGLLTEAGEYTVVSIEDHHVLLEDEHGFVNRYEKKQLVARRQMTVDEAPMKDDHDGAKTRNKPISNLPEIDLHAEHLVDQPSKYSSHDLFETQLQHFRRFMNKQEQLRNPKYVVIHGVGNGRLKEAIREIVQGTPGATMNDANFSANGVGASLIERKYNWR